MKPVERLWWLRFSLAIIMGVISGVMSFTRIATTSTAFIPAIMAILVYTATYFAARYLLGITPDSLPKRSDIVIAGLAPYFICWFMVWVLTITILPR
ncbi:MAG: hypothetical protein QXJ75_00065 [Candidatus Bathyarchaeia archaeon]